MTAPIAIIGGSGLYQMDGLTITAERTITTPYGAPSDALMTGTLDGIDVIFLPRHGRTHAISPSEINYRANIWALKSQGVEQIISVSAVGSMKEDIAPGDFVIIDQFIDRTYKRANTFFHDGIVAHVGFADPVCATLADQLAAIARAHGVRTHRGGTYLCIEGPTFSTRAESQLFRSWGVSVIGMTNYQEAKLAREAELCYATIALATDYDCWHAEAGDVDATAVVQVMHRNVATVQRVIRAAVPTLARARNCPCADALARALVRPLRDAPVAALERLRPIVGRYL